MGTVAAIAGAEASGELDETGTVVGAVAAIEGIDAFRALTAAADPGDAETSSPLPRVGIAGVS